MAHRQLTPLERQKFMYQQGRWHGAIGYYHQPEAGFEMFQSRPFYKDFAIGSSARDYEVFARGFKETQDMRIAVMLAKKDAQEKFYEVMTASEIPVTPSGAE